MNVIMMNCTNCPLERNCKKAFGVSRFQSLTEVPVWKVLQSGADRNHGAIRGREIHLNEHSGWIQVRVQKFPSFIQKNERFGIWFTF